MKDRGKLQRSLERMKDQLTMGIKPDKSSPGAAIEMSDKDKQRLSNEIKALTDRLNGVKKKVNKEIVVEGPKWYIDIFTVKYGWSKKERGKKKKMKTKRVKQTSFVKSVTSRPGLLQRYKEGLEGISPKHHIFKLRRDEIS